MSNGSYRSSSGSSSSSSGRDDAPDAVSDEEAVYRVAQACGVADVVPRTWSERIVAVMPETGTSIHPCVTIVMMILSAPRPSTSRVALRAAR